MLLGIIYYLNKMPPTNQLNNWDQISSEEAFRLSSAEFRGMTIQALKDIREDINDLKGYNNNSRYISMFIAGVAGIVSGILGRTINA